MKTVSELLREAEPLHVGAGRHEEAREQMRRTVIAAASAGRSQAGSAVPRRRAIWVGAGALATAAVVGLFSGVGGQDAVQAAMRFEVRLAEERAIAGLIVARVADSGRTIYLHPELIVTNDDIAQSWVTQDGADHFGVSVQLLPGGAQRMRQATATHIGRPLAILIDGEVVAAPVVRSEIGDSAVISGDFAKAEAERIAEGITRP